MQNALTAFSDLHGSQLRQCPRKRGALQLLTRKRASRESVMHTEEISHAGEGSEGDVMLEVVPIDATMCPLIRLCKRWVRQKARTLAEDLKPGS